ncbi:MAG: T9SS type A sorting domain-containing protein [Saprospiraceae bacterium]
MKILKQLLLMIFCFLLANTLVVKASSILKVKKHSEGGHDHCDYLDCLTSLSPREGNSSTLNNVSLIVTINQDTPEYPFEFPWKAKAFDSMGRFLGETVALYSSDFVFFSENNDLRQVETKISIHPKRIYDSLLLLSAECFENNCYEEYSTLDITFKLFSGETEIDMSCSSFDTPDLTTNSHFSIKEFRTCECYLSTQGNNSQNASFKNEIEQNFISTTSEKLSLQKLVNTPNYSINNNEVKFISVFPNPANSHFFLKFGLGFKEDVKIELISMEGKIIQQTVRNPLEKNILLDVSDIQNGSYFLRITTNKENYIEKVMIIH